MKFSTDRYLSVNELISKTDPETLAIAIKHNFYNQMWFYDNASKTLLRMTESLGELLAAKLENLVFESQDMSES